MASSFEEIIGNNPELYKITSIISWAADVERGRTDKPISLDDRLILVDATIEFAERVRPLFEKYKGGKF